MTDINRQLGMMVSRPPSGQIVVPDPRLDALQAAVSDNLNFVSLKAMIYAADGGDLAMGLKLFEEMQQKDATLYSVAETRRTALTGLDYEIVSAADVKDIEERRLADEAADFVREQLTKIKATETALEYLSTAIGSNLAVVELVWEDGRIIDMIEVPSWRLRSEPIEPGIVRVMTGDDVVGIKAESPKWVVHIPRGASGYPFSRSILRAQAFIYLVKMLAIADWAIFCEIYGMPIRIAQYESGATPEEKAELIEMMTNLGSKAFGIFSRAVTLEFKESSQRGTAPFKDLIDWCDRAQAKIWLGGHLTADTSGGTGTLAAASVHQQVREDLRDDDIRREGQMVREQIIALMCAYRFWREVPLPKFRRIKPEPIDRLREADVAIKAQQTGLKLSKKQLYDRLNFAEPEGDDDVLEPSLDAFGEAMNEEIGSNV